LGLLADDDIVIANGHELLYVARQQARAMAASNFRAPDPMEQILVAGKTGHASLMMIAVNMLEGGFISEHDYEIAGRIASVLTGGDVDAGTSVSQGWLLKLELDNFVELMAMPKTQARVEHMLKTGKPLRN
ncbi:MAG: 3-hydroxyacyl-CoA dehydrogenase, partial [Gammaproteobacteria bacterium]|nr:3-hydroxyacyl-CoA dehydrogenase [Gammaproteobacteria bacterium]